MARAVIIMLDGLRRDFVDPELTPNLYAFSKRAERFAHHRSVFPSATRVVSASFATGCYPARHELQGNSLALLEDNAFVVHDAGHPDFLQHKRRVGGRSVAVPTMAERVADHGGAIVFNNVSPGAAYAHDPDGYGYVYHRAGSFGPGRKELSSPESLDIGFDAGGEQAMAERFASEIVTERKPAVAILWMSEPDHVQHSFPLGSPEHLETLAAADARAGMVIATVDRCRAAGEDILLIVGSDHGHQTVSGVIDVERMLVDAGLKASEGSGDVVAVSNGTASLIYVHPDHADRVDQLGSFLRAQPWSGHVVAADELGLIGQAPHNALAFAVSLASDTLENEYGVKGRSLAAAPRGGKPDRLGCGQHGGLAAYEQSPVLMIEGTGFEASGTNVRATSIIDIAPTVLRHLGLPVDGVDGRFLQT